MPTQLDLSILETVKDPQLRAQLERLGQRMAESPREDADCPPPPTPAKVIQFPLFPHETRPVSNDMARSALFSCVQGVDRRMLKNAVLATVGGVEITFTGEQFNQDDHDVLMQLIFMNWLQVLGYAEPPQIDECVGNQLHAIVPTLMVLEPQQQPLQFVLPGKRPFDSVPYRMDSLVAPPFATSLGTLA